MRRREFITLVVGTAATWPVTTSAQQTGKLPIVGVLGPSASSFAPWAAAFVARMRELGWIDGRTITIEYRWSEGRPDTLVADLNGNTARHLQNMIRSRMR